MDPVAQIARGTAMPTAGYNNSGSEVSLEGGNRKRDSSQLSNGDDCESDSIVGAKRFKPDVRPSPFACPYYVRDPVGEQFCLAPTRPLPISPFYAPRLGVSSNTSQVHLPIVPREPEIDFGPSAWRHAGQTVDPETRSPYSDIKTWSPYSDITTRSRDSGIDLTWINLTDDYLPMVDSLEHHPHELDFDLDIFLGTEEDEAYTYPLYPLGLPTTVPTIRTKSDPATNVDETEPNNKRKLGGLAPVMLEAPPPTEVGASESGECENARFAPMSPALPRPPVQTWKIPKQPDEPSNLPQRAPVSPNQSISSVVDGEGDAAAASPSISTARRISGDSESSAVETRSDSRVGNWLFDSRPVRDSGLDMENRCLSTRRLKQVGVARIRVEVLSLEAGMAEDDDDEVSTVTSDDVSTYGDGETEVYATENDGSTPQNGSDSACIEVATGTTPSSESPSSRNSTRQGIGREASRDRDDPVDEDGPHRKKPRRGPPSKAKVAKGPRFACPYQAYDLIAGHACCRPGPNNPDGGCDGIGRVKQHMLRRHAPSLKCQRCWAHNRTKELARRHEASGCAPKERPTLLMDIAEERKLEERMDSNLSDEDKWWILFGLAYPDKSLHEVDGLKIESPYLPYYFDNVGQGSFVLPPIIVNATSFETTPLGHVRDFNNSDSGLSHTTPSAQVADAMMFRDLHVPLFHAPASNPHGMLPPPVTAPSQTGTNDSASQLSSTYGPRSPFSNTQQSTPATSLPAPSKSQSVSSSASARSTSPDQQQLRQNYERLRRRVAATEAEIEEISDGTRADVRSMGRIFEDIFSMEGLPTDVFEKLREASEVLSSMRKRHR